MPYYGYRKKITDKQAGDCKPIALCYNLYSIRDIAVTYEMSESKVASMLFRMRSELKTHLEKEDNIQNAVIEADLWEKFLNQIDEGSFVYTWNPEISSNTIYDTEHQAHIILTMEDGTLIRLRLIEGGYVGYDALGWYFVQIPGEAFDAIFNTCGGNVQSSD